MLGHCFLCYASRLLQCQSGQKRWPLFLKAFFWFCVSFAYMNICALCACLVLKEGSGPPRTEVIKTACGFPKPNPGLHQEQQVLVTTEPLFSKRSEFNPQHPLVSFQPPKTLVLGNRCLFWPLRVPGMFMMHRHTNRQTHIHNK